MPDVSYAVVNSTAKYNPTNEDTQWLQNLRVEVTVVIDARNDYHTAIGYYPVMDITGERKAVAVRVPAESNLQDMFKQLREAIQKEMEKSDAESHC